DVPVVGNQSAADNFILHAQFKLVAFGVPEMLDQVDQIAAVHLTGVVRNAAFQIGVAHDVNPVFHHILIRLGTFDVSAGGRGHVHNHRSRLHVRELGVGNQAGGGTTEQFRGGDHNVGLGDGFAHGLLLLGDLFGSQLFGVPPGGL